MVVGSSFMGEGRLYYLWQWEEVMKSFEAKREFGLRTRSVQYDIENLK